MPGDLAAGDATVPPPLHPGHERFVGMSPQWLLSHPRAGFPPPSEPWQPLLPACKGSVWTGYAWGPQAAHGAKPFACRQPDAEGPAGFAGGQELPPLQVWERTAGKRGAEKDFVRAPRLWENDLPLVAGAWRGRK